jgi:hypothetical protein
VAGKWVIPEEVLSSEKLSVKTFSYWYRRYKKEKGLPARRNKEVALGIFNPTQVSSNLYAGTTWMV